MTEAATEIKDAVVDTANTDTVDTGTDKAGVDDKAKDAVVDTKADTGTTDTTKADGGADKSVDVKDDKPAALPDNWRELGLDGAGLNKEQRDRAEKLVSRYGSLGGVIKALVEKDDMIRSGKIKRDMPDPKDEKAMAEWRKDQGIPDKPEGYTLPEPVTKRLVDADKPILSSFTEFAHSKNAPPSFVEMAAEWYVDMSEKAAEAQGQADTKAAEEAEDALREAWSRDEYKGNLTLAKRFMASAGEIGDAWTEARLPDGRRLGDIASFVQWASDQGRNAFGDVVFSSSDAEAKHASRKAEIEKIRDTDFDRYEREFSKEYREILEREQKRGK